MKKIFIIALISFSALGGLFFYYRIVATTPHQDFEYPQYTQEKDETEEPAYRPSDDQPQVGGLSSEGRKELVKEIIEEGILLIENVPFTPQAPFAEWEDSRQQDGCEEAASIMAVYWAKGLPLTLGQAKNEIISVSDWELSEYGSYEDTSIKDTADRIIKGYFEYDNVILFSEVTTQSIIEQLKLGRLIIVPTNGQALYNPYFTPPGPERHMLVIKGYDFDTDEFIANDNGTRRGENYRYSSDVLVNAVLDYPSGHNVPIVNYSRAMIAVLPM